MIINVGEIIKNLRKEKGLTLPVLSEKSGVAMGSLSRIENGKMTGRLESHLRICQVLGIELSDLYKGLPRKVLEVNKKKMEHVVAIHDKKFSSELLISNSHGKKIIPLIVRIVKLGRTTTDQTKLGIDKFIYVLEGKVELDIGEEKYILTEGDSVYFDSSVSHYFKNMLSSESRLICIVCPPIP